MKLTFYYLNNKAGIWLAESGDNLYNAAGNAAYWLEYVAYNLFNFSNVNTFPYFDFSIKAATSK